MKNKEIIQHVLVVTREKDSHSLIVDFDEGDLPLDLVLNIMKSIINECESQPAEVINPKDIN